MTKEEILIAYKEGKYEISEALSLLSAAAKDTSEALASNESKNKNIFQNMIYENVLTPLSTVAHHHDVECIERYFSEKFPAHLAIHRVNDAPEQKREYTELHVHQEQEINIIVGDKDVDLIYEVQLEDETYYVKSNSTIWIPSGIRHSCNVVKGSGYYIALRLNPDSDMDERFINNFEI